MNTTPEEIREARRLYWTSLHDLGATKAEIGDAYGVSRERVRQVVGNTGHRPFSDVVAVLRVIREPGITSWHALSLRFPGVSTRPLQRTVEALGLRPAVERLFGLRKRRDAHGTPSGYRHYRCRCAACVAAGDRFREGWRVARMRAGDFEHGRNGYANYRCRCPTCTEGHRRYQRTPEYRDRSRRARHRAKIRGCPPDKHGTGAGYVYYGCRCQACRAANARAWQARKRPS